MDEIKQLNKLTICDESRMRYLLRAPKIDAIAIMFKTRDKILGWASLEKRVYEDGRNVAHDYYQSSVFVHPEVRRRGIAKNVVEQAKKIARKSKMMLEALPRDDIGEKFYSAVGFNNDMLFIPKRRRSHRG